MNLNEGLTKIIKEYPSIKEYVNIKKKEKGLFNQEMENKKNEYSNFLGEFRESIQELVLKNTDMSYNVKYSSLARADIVAYITITNPKTPSINENYYIAYLFKPNGKGVYLCLGLGVNQLKEYKKASFNQNDLDKIKNIANTFRNHVKTINDNDSESDLDFNKFSANCDLESNKNLARAYGAANIYCRYYEFDEDKNIFLPPESELENDLNEFIDLYQYFSNYNDYFNEIKDNDSLIEEPVEKEKETTNKVYDTFYEYLLENGYYFDGETIENYLLSLKVKPFVILTGNSGTGKTKLSQLFAQYLNDKNNYRIIPVGANWTENRHILGYCNILNNKPHFTPAYYLIKQSQEKSYPHFLILDEMNLSHVERYFADFLSAIESKEVIPLAHKKEGLELPDNLFVIGTVNVDETTYMFSPKVLDRANTIEFKTYSAKDYMTNKLNKNAPTGNIKYLEDILKGTEVQEMSIQELEKVFDNEIFWDELSTEIFNFQDILKDAGFDFGFRVINEITRFMAVAYVYEDKQSNWNWKRYFDAQIKQKMLPKLHGSQKVIGETLDKLLEACDDYPTSKAKIKEMRNVLDKQRYVSFIN